MENKSDSDILTVESWNRCLQRDLIPNNVILALYIFLGIFGNSTVIIVYQRKFSKKDIDRFFIPILAIVDLLASILCGSFGIATNMMQATFYNNSLCKTWWFSAAFTTFVSQLLLLTIAVQRYLKVVRPFGRHMNMRHNRIALILIFLVALLLAAPVTISYGSVPFPHPHEAIVGRRCSKIKDENKTFSVFYGSLLGIIALTMVGALTGIYTRIGWTIYKHVKLECRMTKDNRAFQKSYVSSNNESGNIEEKRQIDEIDRGIQKKESKSKVDRKTKTEGIRNREMSSVSQEQREKRNKKIIYKFTLMFMLISAIFLVCDITKVTIMFFEALDPDFWESFNDQSRAVMLFVYRIYIVNSISNPFIYAFLDTKFKQELKSLCCHIK